MKQRSAALREATDRQDMETWTQFSCWRHSGYPDEIGVRSPHTCIWRGCGIQTGSPFIRTAVSLSRFAPVWSGEAWNNCASYAPRERDIV